MNPFFCVFFFIFINDGSNDKPTEDDGKKALMKTMKLALNRGKSEELASDNTAFSSKEPETQC